MAPDVENWDDDNDFHGDLFAQSTHSTAPPSLSSRTSIRSDSLPADDEWQMLITPDDDRSKSNAIASAKHVGFPLPSNIPPSALLGGTIKKLGKQKTRPKINDDDWGDDLEIPQSFEAKLKLKSDNHIMDGQRTPFTPANPADDFDADWAEGSLGIRFGGTRRDQRQRSSSASALSPSMGSCMTFESEDDEMGGLLLPDEPIDFTERLKRKKEDKDSPISQATLDFGGQPQPVQPLLKKQRTEDEDMAFGLDFGNTDLIDKRKRKLHPAIKINNTRLMPSPPRMATTTLTFTEKPAVSRIPRPTQAIGHVAPLDPVYESMASHISPRAARPPPTTTGAQLLRSKRSAPALTSRQKADANVTRPPVPLIPTGLGRLAGSRLASHGRQFSEQDRQSVGDLRSASRLSQERSTPSRSGFRRDVAPASLARQALSKRTITKPKGTREYTGDELDNFDDLPTSAAKESKFIKEPTIPDPRNPKVRSLRHKPSMKGLNKQPDRMTTPQPYSSNPSSIASTTVPSTPLAPPTPKTNSYFPIKQDHTPRFARDTAASRMHREQRTGVTVSTGTSNIRTPHIAPLAPSNVNWKATVAARSPHNSPTANRKPRGEGKQPLLIKQMSIATMKSEKGMTYNPALHRWEGNEHALSAFNNPSTISLPLNKEHVYSHRHSNSNSSTIFDGRAAPPRNNNISPPRPALISQISTAGVRIEGGMVFDPQRMKWLKLDPRMKLDPSGAMSPSTVSIEDEEDPFAGLDDLKDERTSIMATSGFTLPGYDKEASGGPKDDMALGEEFDIGPGFVKRQRHEEAEWEKRVQGWMADREGLGEGWKWAIRDVAREYA